jgi:flagellar hook-associated protein FlgK
MKILSLIFNSTSVETLQQKSKNVFNIFTKTISELTQINKEIEIETKSRTEKINSLSKERDQLEIQKNQNKNLMDKISKLIN